MKTDYATFEKLVNVAKEYVDMLDKILSSTTNPTTINKLIDEGSEFKYNDKWIIRAFKGEDYTWHSRAILIGSPGSVPLF